MTLKHGRAAPSDAGAARLRQTDPPQRGRRTMTQAPWVTDSSPLTSDHNWRARAACAAHDPTLWDTTVTSLAEQGEAGRICADCPVATECARERPEGEQVMIYAGIHPREVSRRSRQAGRAPSVRLPDSPGGSRHYRHECIDCRVKFEAASARARRCPGCRVAAHQAARRASDRRRGIRRREERAATCGDSPTS